MESKLDSIAMNVAQLLWRQDKYECTQDSHERRTKQLEEDMSLLKQAGKE